MAKSFLSVRKREKAALALFVILMAIVIPLTGCANTNNPDNITDTPPKKAIAQTSRGYSVAGQDGYVFSTSYGTFCAGGKGIVNCDVTEKQTLMTFADDIYFLPDACAYNDNTLYTLDPYFYNIYKITFTGKATFEKEVWISYEALLKSPYISNETSIRCMRNWQYADGYIYFNIHSDKENAYDIYESDYTLCKIDVSTKEISLISSSIGVDSYVVHDDMVYYSSNGFDRKTPDIDEYGNTPAHNTKFNTNYIGLYKMKTDGTENTKIATHSLPADNSAPYIGQCSVATMSVFNNHLYFWYCDGDNYSIQRCALDGTSLTTLVDPNNLAICYNWLDINFIIVPESNMLIFKSYNAESNIAGSVDLDTLSKTAVLSTQPASAGWTLCYFSGNIYSICNQYIEGTKGEPSLYSVKHDVAAQKATAIYSYAVYKTITNNFADNTTEQSVLDKIVCFSEDYATTDKFYSLFQ